MRNKEFVPFFVVVIVRLIYENITKVFAKTRAIIQQNTINFALNYNSEFKKKREKYFFATFLVISMIT